MKERHESRTCGVVVECCSCDCGCCLLSMANELSHMPAITSCRTPACADVHVNTTRSARSLSSIETSPVPQSIVWPLHLRRGHQQALPLSQSVTSQPDHQRRSCLCLSNDSRSFLTSTAQGTSLKAATSKRTTHHHHNFALT